MISVKVFTVAILIWAFRNFQPRVFYMTFACVCFLSIYNRTFFLLYQTDLTIGERDSDPRHVFRKIIDDVIDRHVKSRKFFWPQKEADSDLES
jgi:hypothetical protein